MGKFLVVRIVKEVLEVEAGNEEDAEQAACETPIDEWWRTVKETEVSPSTEPPDGSS